MKLPRDLSGAELASRLERLGYTRVRQTGSHIRLSHSAKSGEHHITIPSHQSLRVGTLGAILADVASHLKRDRAHLVRELFG